MEERINDITELHEKLYDVLFEKRKENSSLKFTFRKSNHAGRLEEGYWFYGNNDYLAISFWTGMDWKNRTPNIVLIIDAYQNVFLEVNVSEINKKRTFVENYIQNQLDLKVSGRKYIKEYGSISIEDNDLRSIFDFLENDKRKIDLILKKENKFFVNEKPEDSINFIPIEEFNKRHKKVKQYREAKFTIMGREEQNANLQPVKKPFKLAEITIQNYGLIKNIEFKLNSDNQWIFLTGKNGSGKTILLRALGAVLGNKVLTKKDYKESKLEDFYSNGYLSYQGHSDRFERIANNDVGDEPSPKVQGLAMYGPYRLDVIDDTVKTVGFMKKLGKRESFKSLFDVGEKLLDINLQLTIWRNKNPKRFQQLEYYIKSVFTDIVPNLVDVQFGKKVKGKKKNQYVFFKEDDTGPFEHLEWDELSSGTKSILALLGDIMIRLYNSQKLVYDPSELQGIVIIDEIDLHLHPQAQKDLIVNLTRTFREVQFIVSTHSPIPFLGAPKNSSFFIVSRDSENKIELTHLDIDVEQLLPNTILTSPLFGLTDIANPEYDEMSMLKTEDNYNEAIFYSILDKKIKEDLKDYKDEKN